MRKLLLSLGATALIAVVSAPAAAADGPTFVTQDGTGTAHGSLRYVAVNTTAGHGTDLVEVSKKDRSVGPALRSQGTGGCPTRPPVPKVCRATGGRSCSAARKSAFRRRAGSSS
jgi:hypothetical protein